MTRNDDPTDGTFADARVDRRTFLRLTTATAGTLALPGAATAQVESEKMTDTYRFVANHTPTGDRIQTLLEVADASGLDRIESFDFDVRTTRDPTTAAYARPTPEQVEELVELDAVERLLFSPGANAFWRLGDYSEGVFPPANDSVGFISFEEMVQGIQHLEARHPDRLALRTIGQTAGWYNFVTRETEPQDIWLAEITNDVNDAERFEQKEKVLVFNQDSSERQGPEAMFRFLEDLLEGDEPRVERLLDDIALVFLIANPSGWVANHTYYYSGEEVTPEQVVRTNEYRTLLPTGADPNRSYPTPGYIDPGHVPAEPHGADLDDDRSGVDRDVPPEIAESVPGELDIAEYFRTRDYENLEYGLDLHGFYSSESFLEGFPLNGDYDFEDLADLYALQRSVDEALEESALGQLIASDELQSVFERFNDRVSDDGESPPTPEDTYQYGTLFDILGYSTSGDTISWLSASRENGGLGDVKTFATETVYSVGEFVPDLVDAWVVGNATVIRAVAEHAAGDVSASVETGGASTAYVETDSLTRRSEDLPYGDGGETRYETERVGVTLDGGGTERVPVAATEDAAQLAVTVPALPGVSVRLDGPTGDRIAGRGLAEGADRPEELVVASPAAGEWSVVLEHDGGELLEFDVEVGVLRAESESPNPSDVLGFDQRSYEVSPFAFFEDLEASLGGGGSTRAVTVDEVASGGLVDGDAPAVENLVAIHADGRDDETYVAELDRYVEAGGTLVLTDRGVHLLGAMDADPVAEVGPDDIRDETLFTAFLGDRNDDHPLLAGTDPNAREIGKFVPLGYSIGDDAPMTLVDPEAFTDAGGTVAATTAGEYTQIEPGVAAGSIAGAGEGAVHVVGGLLPPATQDFLHPFGLNEYSVSHLGTRLLANALGYDPSVRVET
ncbi:M14 family zinc carboxypeptidase [Halorussus marinus]|uniref:M14 family zinc carboxypeptidase n=1 Tax=Halorussus marinus TaxID=2505976 RepID=UPI0010933170|nr:M14 family zinc carboxypeptidase [Halorussus marinus]